MGSIGGEAGGFEAAHVLSAYAKDAIAGLEDTCNGEEGFLTDDEPVFFEELRADDRIADAGFVFEADEDDSLCRPGTL
ncbi:MAG: hypothetical protein WD490_10335, partial [Opitutales bacterium]